MADHHILSDTIPDSQFDSLWQGALKTFQDATGRDLTDKTFSKLNGLQDLESALEKSHSEFIAYRSRNQKAFEIIKLILKPIELFSDVAAGGAAVAFPPSRAIFGAVTCLIAAGASVSSGYDTICDLFTELSAFMRRLEIHMRPGETAEQLRSILTEVLCSFLRLCGYSAKAIKSGRGREYFKRLFVGKNNDIARELDNLKQLVSNEERLVVTLTYDGVQEIRSNVNRLAQEIARLSAKDASETTQSPMENIRQVLRPCSLPEDMLRSFDDKSLEDSGQWIQQESAFKTWLKGESLLLRISGRPGVGKSFLSSRIIHFLKQYSGLDSQQSTCISVAYFFCKDDVPDLRSIEQALRTVAYQIAEKQESFARHLAHICAFPESIKMIGLLWRKVFVDFFSGSEITQRTAIVIDGVDECGRDDRKALFKLLRDYETEAIAGSNVKLQILLVVTPELVYEMAGILRDPVLTVEVSALNNKDDIRRYVTAKIQGHETLRLISLSLRKEIIRTLDDAADGMFLWVDLMLQEVQRNIMSMTYDRRWCVLQMGFPTLSDISFSGCAGN